MRGLGFLGLSLIALGAALGADTQPAVSPTELATKIDQLIDQLGSAKFAEREKAQRALEAIGVPALEALQRATKSDEQERSRRAGELAQKIGAKVAAATLLAPKRVNLALKNVPVSEALAALQRQSGYKINFAGDRAVLESRKVTLNTGDTSFWEAFDKLCQAADLVEVPSAPPADRRPILRPIRRQRGLPVLPVVPPANPAPAPILQVQAGAVPALPVPPAIAPPLPRIDGVGFGGTSGASQITVKDGKPPTLPTHYAGAVRIRAVPFSAAGPLPRGDGEFVLLLDVSAEPRLENFSADMHPTITRAVDDHGQNLTVAPDPGLAANPNTPTAWGLVTTPSANRQVQVRLKRGDKQAKTLKELQGTISAQTLTGTEPLVVVDNVLKAAGKSAKSKDGGSLEVLAVDRQAGGEVRLRLRLHDLAGRNPNGGIFVPRGALQIQQFQVRVQAGGNVVALGNEAAGLPSLFDANGFSYELIQIPSRSMRAANGQVSEEMTLVYRAHPGLGDPTRLVLSGKRTVSLEVPFTLRNVPLQ
jgi:hypothetical protein